MSDIVADLHAANAHAKRFPAYDHIGRLNTAHTQAHARLNALLDQWEAATALTATREAHGLPAEA